MSSGDGAERELQVFLVAGEESGDRLGSALMRALKRETSQRVQFQGVGGPEMSAEGLTSIFPITDLAIIGVVGIFRKLPTILARIREAADAVIAAKPDILVIIDSPEFTHRVAKRVRTHLPSLRVVDYVSPSVWAWRPWRAKSMRRYVDHVLALLPFEPEAHQILGGPACTYVGHPLSERIATLRPTEAEMQRRMSDPPIVLVLPGSRQGEIRRLMEPFAETVANLHQQIGPLEFVLPTVPHLREAVIAATSTWSVRPRVIVEQSEKDAAFRTARAALAASGTVTLELAVAGVPLVAAYRVSRWDAFIARRLVRAHSAILANLVLGENVVPEFLQEDCTPAALTQAVMEIVRNTPARERQVSAFAKLDEIMQIGRAEPSVRAAEIVLAMARSTRP